MQAPSESNVRNWQYYTWPVGIICFFILLAIGNGWLLITAINGRPDPVVGNPYKDSLQYDKEVKKLQLAHKLKLSASIELNEAKPSLLLTLLSDGSPYAPESISIEAKRADDASYDTEITLMHSETPGIFSGILNFPVKGLWMLDIKVATNQGLALVQQKLFVPAPYTEP